MSEICNIIQEIGELSFKYKAAILNLLSSDIDIKDLPTCRERNELLWTLQWKKI